MSSLTPYDYTSKTPEEFHTQEWASSEDLAHYTMDDDTQAIILARGVNITPHYYTRDFRYAINNNVFCVGGSGAGKTVSLVLPNLLNHLPQTYVATDTKGELSKFILQGFKEDGYDVTVLDTINLDASDKYDPLRYVSSDEDIVMIAELLYYSTRAAGREATLNSRADPFWDESGTLLFRALLGMLRDLERVDGALAEGAAVNAPRKYLTMKNLLSLTQMLCISESDDGENTSPLDIFVKKLSRDGLESASFSAMPSSYGVEQYNDFRVAAGRTLKSILISLNASLTKLRGEEFAKVFSGDEMRLDELGTRKRLIVLKMSDCDSSKSFLAQIALKQLIQQAFKAADANEGGKLKIPVQFILDEFPNVGRIPDFPRIISTARSRNMSFVICAQSMAQLSSLYGVESQVIYDSCDTIMYMGSGSSLDTAEYISKLCGTTKVGTTLRGIEKTERDIQDSVISASELRLLPRDECIVLISGLRPIRAKKYNGFEHPNAARFLNHPAN